MSIDNMYKGPDLNKTSKDIYENESGERIKRLKERLSKLTGQENLDNIDPEKLLLKTIEFYNNLFHTNFPDDNFEISLDKNKTDNLFTLKLNREPNEIFEEIKNQDNRDNKSQYINQQRKMRLIGTLLLDFEPTTDPLTITKQILDIIERFLQKESSDNISK